MPSLPLSLPVPTPAPTSQEGTMNNGGSDVAPGDVPPLLPSQPHGTSGAPALQGETHRGGIAVGRSIVVAVLPAWFLTSPTGCESHPDRPAA